MIQLIILKKNNMYSKEARKPRSDQILFVFVWFLLNHGGTKAGSAADGNLFVIDRCCSR